MSTNDTSASKDVSGNANASSVTPGASAPLNSLAAPGTSTGVVSATPATASGTVVAAPNNLVPANVPVSVAAAAAVAAPPAPLTVAPANVAAAAAAAVARIPTPQVSIAVTNAAVAAAGTLDINSVPAVNAAVAASASATLAPVVAAAPVTATAPPSTTATIPQVRNININMNTNRVVVANTTTAAASTVKTMGVGLAHQFQQAQQQQQAQLQAQRVQPQPQQAQTTASSSSSSWSVPNPLAMLGGTSGAPSPSPSTTPAAVPVPVPVPNVNSNLTAATAKSISSTRVATTTVPLASGTSVAATAAASAFAPNNIKPVSVPVPTTAAAVAPRTTAASVTPSITTTTSAAAAAAVRLQPQASSVQGVQMMNYPQQQQQQQTQAPVQVQVQAPSVSQVRVVPSTAVPQPAAGVAVAQTQVPVQVQPIPMTVATANQVQMQPQAQTQVQQMQTHVQQPGVVRQVPVGTVTVGVTTKAGGVPGQPQVIRRKLVLTAEGRTALTKAVLSSLKDPNGIMDPTLLQHAMQITKLSEKAILNAAKMAKEREEQKKKRMAMGMNMNGTVNMNMARNVNANVNASANVATAGQGPASQPGVGVVAAQQQPQTVSVQGGGGVRAPQQIIRSNTGVMVVSGGAVTHTGAVASTASRTPVPAPQAQVQGQTQGVVYHHHAHPGVGVQASSHVNVPSQVPAVQHVQHTTSSAGTHTTKTISVPIPMPTPVGAPYKPQLTPQQQQQQQMQQEKLRQQRLQQEQKRQQQLKQQQAIQQEKLRQEQLRQQKIQQQKKEAQERAKARALEAAAIAKEMSRWNRIHHGVFTKSATSMNGGSTSSSKSASSNGKQVRAYSLGAVSRCQSSTPALTDESNKTAVTEDMWRNIFAIQSQVKKSRNVEGIVPREKLASSSSPTSITAISGQKLNKPRRFENATIALSDVTDKSKRLKLQPKKEGRALEKNLRKHRQITCETLVKKHKELNKQIMSHSSEFYKFHRTRKLEISKFARSVRDHVAMIQRKKEKGAVNEEKARISALKANDMQAYSQLVQETRNERLKFLLDKTDSYIHKISGLLKDQHSESGTAKKKSDDSDEDKGGVEVVGNSRLPLVEDEAASSYYQTAHVRQEEVKQPSILVGGKLKEYQIAGLQWLVSLYNNKLNGILADEMGLGKTVQTIALIAYLMEIKDNRGPYLVVVPLSTLSNWVNEFVRWCPSATVIVYKGTPAQRKGLFKAEVRGGHFNVLLTTYEYIIKDKASLRKLQWEYAIVDEGHRMKNAQSKFAVTLGTAYVTKHRVLLTGTPLQNSLPELWALLNFLLPSVFNSVETFDQWFNKPFAQFGSSATTDGETEEVVNTEERLLIIQRLHELLRPFMLRRIKADVLDQLPDKVEKVLRCELSSWQKELYKQISYNVLADGQKKSKRGLNNVVMQLRKVCNHPYMFTPEGYYITEDIIRTSGKVELLDRMLPKLKAAGHRVLMFFQMTAAMTILEDYFKLRGILSLRLDGSTTGEERERRMDLFNAPNSPYFVFMLSTRAGGLGLNLVSADTVIIFDSDWNPMMDLQAQDRAHRIGQKKVVSVFRLITNSPVEEKILSRATEKLNMSEIIVEAGKFDKSGLEDDGVEERQKLMEVLLTDFSTNSGKGNGSTTGNLEEDESGDDEKEEIDINELLSRNDEDFEFYSKMDSGEIKDPDFFESPGLLTDPKDIPDWIKYPNKNEENDTTEDGVLLDPGQRRAAAAKTTGYDDGLTEKQFLRIMEKQAKEEEDAAKARKIEWKQKRDKSAAAAAASLTASNGNHEAVSTITPAIFERLVSMTKSIIAIRDKKTKRRHSDIFREQPSRDEYPDYYQIIEKPIAINDIMKKCRGKIYTSVRQYHADFMLMFANAKKFNGETSWIANDANVLEAELNRLLNKYKILEEEPKEEKALTPKKKKPRIKLSLKKLSSKRKKDSGTSTTPKSKRQRTG